ncbi:TRAP transporter fused permease subunit [Pseudooceanicola sp.]|uniref:TRAP transporter permease n=1 Tax=Pseudooceanicola sp. TaxID=1914328 RepID=UPI00260EB359|nr:TRAP transporter fused permease subunit [Pseudooceanicola sp.]MDF1857051.1 TRAP transporter fused permease subunit [Pseudooceanicola sp.]
MTEPTELAWGWRREGTRLSGTAWFAATGLSALGILIAVNQVFLLRPFGFTLLSTAYYYTLAGLFLAVAFLANPATKAQTDRVRWFDWIAAFMTLVSCLYLATQARNIISMGWELDAPTLPTMASFCLIVAALEAVRRCGGGILFCICLVFGVFPLFADSLPGFLWGMQFTPLEATRAYSMGLESIIGVPTRVLADLVIGFIIFGVALSVSGGGRFFMDIANALLGGTRGGPAKVAIVSSGFFGSLSGSVISNVIGTGSMTIPTMTRTGYPARYAAAIEACASTGGALMPPVMGSVAFIMASFLNVPYSTIMVAAVVPATLFYAILILQADSFAAVNGLKGLPRSQLPKIGATFKSGWIYCFSLVLLIYLLLGLSLESRAPFIVTVVLLITTIYYNRSTGALRAVCDLVLESGVGIASLVGIVAGIGLIVGSLSITGVGNAFSRELVQYADGNLFLILVLGALTSFVLGMGMTASACYIFLAVVLAPVLVQSGLNPIASHLFILYWGMLSYITPPVALAAVAAASIARVSAMRTGVSAMRLGAVLFVLPFMFVYNPALVMQGRVSSILLSSLTALAAIFMISCAAERYMYFHARRLNWIETVLLAVGGLMLMAPEHRTDLVGLAILVMVYGRPLVFRASPDSAAKG